MIALLWSRIARSWRSSARQSPTEKRSRRKPVAVRFMAARLTGEEEAHKGRSFELSLRGSLQRRQPFLGDRLSNLPHPIEIEEDVVKGEQHRGGKILYDEEVSDVGARMAPADRASAGRIVFFFNDTATTEIYTLSLHDSLPI